MCEIAPASGCAVERRTTATATTFESVGRAGGGPLERPAPKCGDRDARYKWCFTAIAVGEMLANGVVNSSYALWHEHAIPAIGGR